MLSANGNISVRFKPTPTAVPNDYLQHTDDGRALVLGDEDLTGWVPQLVPRLLATGETATWTIRTTRGFDAIYSNYSRIRPLTC